jgi:hypothetical protein
MSIPTTKVIRTRSVVYPPTPAKSRRADAVRTKYKAKRPTKSQSIDILMSLWARELSNRNVVQNETN